jgi:hypothetical protein
VFYKGENCFIREKDFLVLDLLIRIKKGIIFGFKGLKNRSPGVSISGFTVVRIYKFIDAI